jgi:glycolate oxidase iron-sulfur subunit
MTTSVRHPAATPALHDTPLGDAARGLDMCVHCGFCLQACPTYLATSDENDSPRGRLVLMREWLDGGLDIGDAIAGDHIARCLGCRACETACPSGVPYGQLLEATRATIGPAQGTPAAARVVLYVMAHPALLRIALAGAALVRWTRLPSLLARLPGRAGFAMAMLAASRSTIDRQPYSIRGTKERGAVTLLEGCIMRGLFADTNRSTRRTLAVNNYDVCATSGQGCCGALHAHAGDVDGARNLARRNIAAFEQRPEAKIAVNAAGCGAMMKEYAHLFHGDTAWTDRARAVAERVRDVSELLAAAGPRRGGPLPAGMRVTYDPPCHLLHAQRVSDAPLAVLNAIPGLTLVPLDEEEQCCGGAGIYNLVEPALSGDVLNRKMSNVAATRADFIATGNPGCHMQIGAGALRAGLSARMAHPVDLLDASYAAERV